jgi:nitrite reductase/ring-hydroxylating ferredoxin subunit
MKEAKLQGRSIVVVNLGDTYVAFPNACLHYQVRLSEGKIDGDVVTCRWHQWEYCVRTGDVLTDESPYATMVTFAVTEQDGELFVSPRPRTKITPRPDYDSSA